jgi:hypothetical protein
VLPCQGAVKHSTFAFGFPHLRAPNSRIRRHPSSSLFHFSQPASAYFNSPCFLIPAAKMDPLLAKKQKINPKKPIAFKSAGMKPDIYFKVFDQEFYVTSMVLKLHSGFFRTFLDPAGGKLPKSTQPGSQVNCSRESTTIEHRSFLLTTKDVTRILFDYCSAQCLSRTYSSAP